MLRSIFGRGPLSTLSSRKVAQTVVPGSQQVILQRVKIRPRRGIIRRTAGTLLVGYVCFSLYTEIVSRPLRNLQISEKELTPAKDDRDKSIFIPFPFTTVGIFEQRYKPDDPEVVRMQELGRDRKQRDRVRAAILRLVLTNCERSLLIRHKIGKNLHIDRCWLEFSYPMAPPPVYVRSGLEVNDDNIQWKTRRIDWWTLKVLRHYLFPDLAAQASWAFLIALLRSNVNAVTQYFGMSDDAPQAAHRSNGRIVGWVIPVSPSQDPLLRAASTSILEKNIPSPSSAKNSASAATPPAAKLTRQQTTTPTSRESQDGKKWEPRDLIPYYDHIYDRATSSYSSFRTEYFAGWKSFRDQPPRGSVLVQGLISLHSDTGGWIQLDVWTWYDPKKKELLSNCTVIHVRDQGVLAKAKRA